MKLRFAAPLALAAATFSLAFAGASTSRAVNYTETSDAGDLPGTAQPVYGPTGTSLTSITGGLTLTNAISDSDMFEIYISDPTNFSASTTAFIQGFNNFDTQLYVFSITGLGVVGNDDAASGGSQSSIPAGSLSTSAGLYYILISGSGRYATSSGGLIFPSTTDGVTDASSILRPTGPGGASPITGYTGNSNDGGSYVIALTGAQFVAAVPEPGTFAAIAAGAAGLALVGAIRRRNNR